MVELLQPRLLIHRYAGQDVRILVDHPYVYLRAEDVEKAAGVPPWSTGETLLLDEGQQVDIGGTEWYPLDEAQARAGTDSTDPAAAAAFLTWLDGELPTLLDQDTLEAAHRVPGFATALTIAGAAHQVGLGRDALFDRLEEAGWITRPVPDGDWAITPTAHARDWLTIRDKLVAPRTSRHHRSYPQIHVTPAGMTELRQLLGALPDRSPS